MMSRPCAAGPRFATMRSLFVPKDQASDMMPAWICATARAPLALVGTLLLAAGAAAQPLPPDIVETKVINAPVADVWKAWTTFEGIESFFAPK